MPSSLAPAMFKGGNAETVLADGHQLGHQQTNHAVEKATGLNLDPQKIALAFHEHLLHGGSRIRDASSLC